MGILNLNINKKLIIGNTISFVITENCPYLCAHCMRGERGPSKISEKVIDNILSQITINGTVHLTGGEPLLAVEKIIYLLNRIYRLGNNPREISIITNSSASPEKFEKFVSILDGKDAKLNLMISDDRYHKKERRRLNDGKDNLLEIVSQYQKILDKHKSSRPSDDYPLLVEKYESFRNGKGVSAIGRGINIAGSSFKEREFCLYKRALLVEDRVKGKFQVHTNGIITPMMDMSWKERDKYYGQEYNCLKHPLIKILKQ